MNCFAHSSVKTGFKKEHVPSEGSWAGGKQAQHGCKFFPRAWGWCAGCVLQSPEPGPAPVWSSSRDEQLQSQAQGVSVPGAHQFPPALVFALTVSSFPGTGMGLVPQLLDCPKRLPLISLKRLVPSPNLCQIPLLFPSWIWPTFEIMLLLECLLFIICCRQKTNLYQGIPYNLFAVLSSGPAIMLGT